MPASWKAPTWLIGLNTVLAFVNALFLGAGAKVWGYNTALWAGLIFAALIIPVFVFRHYIQDGGKFPKGALEDLGLKEGDLGRAQGRHAALSCTRRRCRRGPLGQLVLRVAELTDHAMTKPAGSRPAGFLFHCFGARQPGGAVAVCRQKVQ